MSKDYDVTNDGLSWKSGTPSGSRVYIDVKAYAGSAINCVIDDMVRLAKKLEISVWGEINNIMVLARPDDESSLVVAAYWTALGNNDSHAVAETKRLPTTIKGG